MPSQSQGAIISSRSIGVSQLDNARKSRQKTDVSDIDEEYPEGFPRLAAWVSSDRDLEMTRGFKYLYQRTLVQDVVELNELEKELFEADKMEAAQPAPNFSLRHTREEQDGNTKHRELRETIRKALKKHSKSSSLSRDCDRHTVVR